MSDCSTDAMRPKARPAGSARMCQMTMMEPPMILEGWWSCSECGPVFPPCNVKIAEWALVYCPHCGAKVIKEKDKKQQTGE